MIRVSKMLKVVVVLALVVCFTATVLAATNTRGTIKSITAKDNQFVLADKEPVLRKVAIPAAAFGTADTVELTVDAGSTFVPKDVIGSGSQDFRELGVRVFHAFVEPK